MKFAGKSLAERVAAALLGLGTTSVERAMQSRSKLQDFEREKLKEKENESIQRKQKAMSVDKELALDAVVDICLSNASEGRSFLSFERDAERNRRRGVQVGHWPCSRSFCREVEFYAARALQNLDAMDFQRLVVGLGIPSDFCALPSG